ncbi:MAG: amidase [Candidatus Eremiobacteraeota bacterium]|nr:amidase [Candidatus Eremiobacteraeota bacterium]MBC5827454.1 amidase [Candidatus Eremiobacteraeota bacterium]
MSDAALAFASIDDLGRRLRRRTVSSAELAAFYLKRLERFGPRLNSVVTLLHERAMAEARQADAELARGRDRGPLHGIPYGVKDLVAVRGAPTTWGAQPYRGQSFPYDATVVKRLRAAGAVVIAKLAMIELAGGMGYNQADASFTGPCKTPWNLKFWSGGSSSGSGSSVSAGLVPFAIGSETDGSIMSPANNCGVSGLRPTYGRVSRHGAMALCWTLDKLGPLCRSARDAGLVLSAIAGRDADDSTSVRRPFDFPAPARARWRLATVKGAADKTQPAVKKNYMAALSALREIASIEEVSLPEFPYDAMVGSIIAAEGGAAFREIIQDGRIGQLADPDGRRGGYSYLVTYAVDYVDAMRERRPLRQALNAIFAKVDALVAPTYSTVAPPIDIPFDKAYPGFSDGPLISACNLAGIPAVSVPSGFGASGLPTGVMFVGRAFGEAEIIGVADAFQSRTDWHRRHPLPAFA